MSRRYASIVPALAGAAAISLLASCAEMEGFAEDVLDETTTVAYDCDDDRSFTASYSADREEVSVDTEDETYRLELTDREDDQHVYSDEDGDVQLTADNDGAELDLEDGDDFEDCEAERG